MELKVKVFLPKRWPNRSDRVGEQRRFYSRQIHLNGQPGAPDAAESLNSTNAVVGLEKTVAPYLIIKH